MIGMNRKTVRNILAGAFVSSALGVSGAFAMSLGGDDAKPRVEEAQKLIDAKEYDKAAMVLDQIVKEDDGNADAWNLLGYSLRKEGKLTESQDAYVKALKIDPFHQGTLEYQGELYLIQDRLDLAMENLDKLKNVCPEGCEARSELEKAIAAYNLDPKAWKKKGY